MENWKNIKGYNNKYQVSDYGNICSCGYYVKDSNGRTIFIQAKSYAPSYTDGSYYVHLKGKHFLLSKLVFETFIGKPRTPVKYEHIDGNKANCSLSNLRLKQFKKDVK